MTTEVLDAPAAASQQGDAASTPAPAAAPAAAAPAGTLATSAAAQPQQAADGQQPAAPGEGAQASPPGDSSNADEAAPEKYEFKAPEGVELDESVTAAFSDVAKGLKLSQDAAQQLVEKLAPVLAKSTETKAQAFFEDIGGAPATWADKARGDKEFGGDKFDANLSVAAKAMTLATPEMRALLDKTRVGDHPEMIRWMYRVGKALSEDTFVAGNPPPAVPADPAKRMFPYMN